MPPYPSSLDPGALASQIEASYAQLERARFADALWQRRLDAWSADVDTQRKIANRLGWLTVLDFVQSRVAHVESFAQAVRTDGFTDVVLLGMGGSSLAPEVMRQTLGVAPGFPRFRMLDSIDPAAVRDVMARAATTLFVVASKSGSTIEPNVMAAEARRRVEAAGHHPWGSRFMAITDEGTELHDRARAEYFREIVLNPADIGGRYSALSMFGMVPAALMGIPLAPLLAHGRAMAESCRISDPRQNPGLTLGAVLAAAAQSGRDKLTLVVPEKLAAFGLWVEQLVAESTGKQGKGIVPIAGEPLLPRYGDDRISVVVELGGGKSDPAVVDRLRATGAPIMTLQMADERTLGAEFFRWEVATATAGSLLGINPFDEPNVQQAKDATRALLSAYVSSGTLPTPAPHATATGANLTLSAAAVTALGAVDPHRFLRVIRPGDYVATLAYVSPADVELARIFERFRAQVAERTRAATMFGYGPRYLHSTGQLHKGGAPNGVFLILSATPVEDLPIPGAPYSFGVLQTAQAVGDFTSLDESERRALLVRLPSPSPATLKAALVELLNAL